MVFTRKTKPSLQKLQLAVDKERIKVIELKKRELLTTELKTLKSKQKNDTLTRIGRGFKVLGKKAGRGALRQAKLLQQRQLVESKKLKKRKKGTPAFDPFERLSI